MKTQQSKSRLDRFKSPVWAVASSILLVGLVIGLLILFGVHEQLLTLLQWVEAQGIWAAILFILLMAAVVVLLLPGILFTTGAGFVFGVLEGTAYVVLGTTLGAIIAFALARFLLGQRARNFILQRSKLHSVNEEMTRHAFKVVLLTRLIPFFPGKLSNYFYGLTSFSFRGFALGSLLGFIPFSLHNVYLGSLAADLASLEQGQLGRSPLQWGLYALGFLATVVAVVFFNRLARQALARLTPPDAAPLAQRTDAQSAEPSTQPSTQPSTESSPSTPEDPPAASSKETLS